MSTTVSSSTSSLSLSSSASPSLSSSMSVSENVCNSNDSLANNFQKIKEGGAEIFLPKDVFYNPVQEFNRDMSVLVLDTYFENELWNRAKKAKRILKHDFKLLDALSASGLRCIRYEKELRNKHKIAKYVSNDYSEAAVQMIERNVKHNGLVDRIDITNKDATDLMYANRAYENRFLCIDVDPYGCAGPFLDAAVQSILDGGLLMVTATDLAILCGNNSETCFAKYGSVSLRIDACHEMALRIMLKSIETAAARYGRYIKPLISISVDFYIRIFVQVFTSPSEAKKAATNSALVYNCVTCNAHHLQPFGRFEVSSTNQQTKHSFAHGPPVGPNCSICGSKFHVGGPIWAGPIHDFDFVRLAQEELQKSVTKVKCQKEKDDGEEENTKEQSSFGTYRRMNGMLQVISEELPDIPLFYTPAQFTHLLKCVAPTFMSIRSAILNAGCRVSYSHTNPVSLKTDASLDLLWDIMITWSRKFAEEQQKSNESCPKKIKLNGESNENEQKSEENLAEDKHPSVRDLLRQRLMKKQVQHEISFEAHPDEIPKSKSSQLVRFQVNPTKNWGPKPRVKPMSEEGVSEFVDKRLKNQGKRSKRQLNQSDLSTTD